MKQMPRSFRHASETSGGGETFTPSAASTSALPERLVAARLPCFATGSPAPAMTKAAAVETLKVFAELEPVPAVSMKHSWRERMRTARARMADASPANSSTVSPFTASATSAAPICESVAPPSSSAPRNAAASSRRRFWPRISRKVNSRNCGAVAAASSVRAGVGRSHAGLSFVCFVSSDIGGLKLQKVCEQAFAFGREDGFGVELHALNFQTSVAQAHYDSVGSRGGDFETVWQALALDDERVVAARVEAVFEPLEYGLAVVANLGGLAVDWLGRAHDPAAENLADGLVAEADAEDGDVAREVGYQLQRHARVVGHARPRRDDDAVGAYLPFDFAHRDLVVAAHDDLRAQLAEILDEVVRERVVVIYQENLIAHRPDRSRSRSR